MQAARQPPVRTGGCATNSGQAQTSEYAPTHPEQRPTDQPPRKGDTQEAASGPRSSMGCALQRGYEFRSFALSESHLGCRRRCDRGPDRADGPGCHHTVSMTPRAVSRGCGTQRRPPAGGLFALPTRRPPVVMCLGLARDLSRARPKTSSLGTTTRDLGKFKSALGDPLLRRATGVLTAPSPFQPGAEIQEGGNLTPFRKYQLYELQKRALPEFVVIIFQGPDLVAAKFKAFLKFGTNSRPHFVSLLVFVLTPPGPASPVTPATEALVVFPSLFWAKW